MAEHERRNIKGLVTSLQQKFSWPTGRVPQPVGRLDKGTTGLLLLTDNGDIGRILQARQGVPKTYVATVGKAIVTDDQLQKLMGGIPMKDGGPAVAINVEVAGEEVRHYRQPGCGEQADMSAVRLKIRIQLAEGRNHIVRRMFHAVGLPIQKLHREAIGCLSCENLGLKSAEDATEVAPRNVLELLATCGGSQDPFDDLQRRGRAIYNALRCGSLLCSLRRGCIEDAQQADRLWRWLQDHWTLQGACMGPFRELCINAKCSCPCEDPSSKWSLAPSPE